MNELRKINRKKLQIFKLNFYSLAQSEIYCFTLKEMLQLSKVNF